MVSGVQKNTTVCLPRTTVEKVVSQSNKNRKQYNRRSVETEKCLNKHKLIAFLVVKF